MGDSSLRNVSSGFFRSAEDEASIAARIAAALEEEPVAASEDELSPAFKELSEPRLPALPRDNRARLQMQTPTKLYFYWSLKNNPWQILQRAFGNARGSYTLVVKLINLSRETEEIHPADAEGNWWFNVDSNSEYRAEVGFYAPNRPYFRALHSNTVTTPRKGPSPRAATDADWVVTADAFAQVLDASGFTQDAYEVALAGDDRVASEQATRQAFADLVGDVSFDGFAPEELRFALMALASGVPIEELRWKISASLFALLQANLPRLSTDAAAETLRKHFDFGEDEIVEEEQKSAVFGASVVHFPKTVTRRRLPRPLGEFDVPGSARPSSSSNA